MCSVVFLRGDSDVLFSQLDNVLFGEEFNYVLFGGREKTVVAPGEGRPRLLYQPVPNSLPAQLLS